MVKEHPSCGVVVFKNSLTETIGNAEAAQGFLPAHSAENNGNKANCSSVIAKTQPKGEGITSDFHMQWIQIGRGFDNWLATLPVELIKL